MSSSESENSVVTIPGEGGDEEATACGGTDPQGEALAMLVCCTQIDGRVLPVGSLTERKLLKEIQRVTGVSPIAATKVSDREVLVEFEPKVSVTLVAMKIQKQQYWDEIPVVISGVMAGRATLVKIVKDREDQRTRQGEGSSG